MKATPETLARAGRAYLDRYAACSGQLRRMLLARVDRSARAHGTPREEGVAAIEVIIARARDQGLLDDAAYAEAKAASLHRRGNSLKAVAGHLRLKGLEPLEVRRAIASLRRGIDAADEVAAATYCRKRRMGPHRPAGERAAMRGKDMAALARRGFPYAVALLVLDGGTD